MESKASIESVNVLALNETPSVTEQQSTNRKKEDLLKQIIKDKDQIVLKLNCQEYAEQTGQFRSPVIVNLNELLKVLSTLDIVPKTELTIIINSSLGIIDSELVSELKANLSAIKNITQLSIFQQTKEPTRYPQQICLFSRFDHYFSFIGLSSYNYKMVDSHGNQIGFNQFIRGSTLLKEYHYAHYDVSPVKFQKILIILLNNVFEIKTQFTACEIPQKTRQLSIDSQIDVKSAEISNLKQQISLQIGFIEGFTKNFYRLSYSLLRLIQFDEAQIYEIELKVIITRLPTVEQVSNQSDPSLKLEQLGKLPIFKHVSLVIPKFRFDSKDSDLFSLVQFVKSARISIEKYFPTKDCQIDRVLQDIHLSKSKYSNLTSFFVEVSGEVQIKPMLAIANALPNLERFQLKAIYPPSLSDILMLLELFVPFFHKVKELEVTEILSLIGKENLLKIVICPARYFEKPNAQQILKLVTAILETITAFPRPINVLLKISFGSVLSLNIPRIINRMIQSVLHLPNVCNLDLVIPRNEYKKKDEFQLNLISDILFSRNLMLTSIVAYDSFIKPYLTFNPEIILFDLFEDL